MIAREMMKNFIDEFKQIDSEAALTTFTNKHGLVKNEGDKPSSQVLGIYCGVIGGKQFKIAHRWYDRCKTFSVQPDGNKVLLEVEGEKSVEVSFLDDM